MIDQNLIDYIHQQRQKNIDDHIIQSSLISAGWDPELVREALEKFYQTTSKDGQQKQVDDKTYPIQNKLIFKQVLSSFSIITILFFMYAFNPEIENEDLVVIIIYFLAFVLSIVILYLKKRAYHYELQEKHLVLHQGILNKQQRTLQYGVIQNVLVKQGILDRLFGIATLIIENAAGPGDPGYSKVFGIRFKSKQQKNDLVGFRGNKVSIPGLNKSDAETLKEILLEKIKQNPIEDKQSGL